jgi:zinc protease
VTALSGDHKLALGLLIECLTQPSFPEDSFKRLQQQMLSDLVEEQSQPAYRAREGFREAVYGAKHPLGRPAATLETLKNLKRADVVAFHKKVYVPSNTILAVVGDFDAAALAEEIKTLTADWKGEALKKPVPFAIPKPEKFTQKIVTMPDAAQLHFYLGHAGITRKDPDYYKLLVMDYVLGTGPGFTDRLSARLRDREGLAYTVNANITSSAGVEPGTLTCYIGTDVKNFDRVKKEFLEELNRIRDTKATKEEVEDAKQYLLGNLPFRFATSAGIVGQLLMVERFGLGLDYLEEFRKGVSAVTVDDVQAVAKKHIDPMHMVLVAAGALDATGKPVTPPKPDKEPK